MERNNGRHMNRTNHSLHMNSAHELFYHKGECGCVSVVECHRFILYLICQIISFMILLLLSLPYPWNDMCAIGAIYAEAGGRHSQNTKHRMQHDGCRCMNEWLNHVRVNAINLDTA